VSFVHLHTHSEFSALDGLSTIDEAVAQAVNDDQPALAITDHGVCAGHPALSKAANKAGIKPIFGLEAYFVNDRRRRPIKPSPETTEEEAEALKAQNALIRAASPARSVAPRKSGLYQGGVL
jgi:DNA polymerase III alpha subunit